MSYKDIVQKNNPVAFSIIDNAMKMNKLSHSYIFSAEQGVSTVDVPLFFVENILSQHEGTNNDPLKYTDLIMIDGSESLIKKEQITSMVDKLQETTLDQRGYKFVIIRNIENANVQSLNSLLKFIEEPTDKTYFLITTNNLPAVISTIKSRSQVIPVKRLSKEQISSELLEKGIPKKFVNLLASISETSEEALDIYGKDFKEKYNVLVEALKSAINNKGYIFTNLPKIITKTNFKISILILKEFVSDIWKVNENIQLSFTNETDLLKVYALSNFDYAKAMFVINDFILKQRHYVNFDLYRSKMLLEIMECYG